MQRHFAIWFANSCIISFFLVALNLSADSAVFTGKLVRKYYQHLIPQAMELDAFGWFLELDSFSKIRLKEKIAALSEEDRQCCMRLEFDSSIVQLCLSGIEDRQLCRRFEGEQVEAAGEWPSSPHVYRPIPSYQLHLTHMKQIPVETAGLSGILLFKVFPGPPNYDCVEDGDYPEGCWLLKLDDRSKDILVATMDFDDSAWGGEVIIETKNDLSLYVNRKVSCQGTFRYAETGHHHTPLLLRLCRTILEDVP